MILLRAISSAVMCLTYTSVQQDLSVLSFSLKPSKKHDNSTLKCTTTASFQILYKFPISIYVISFNTKKFLKLIQLH